MEKFAVRETPQFASPEEELVFLREQIASKEKALESKGEIQNKESAIIQTIDQYKNIPANEALSKDFRLTEKQTEKIVLELTPEDHDDTMAELLAVLQEKGIKNTFAVVDKLSNPHIEDDFHRFLVQYIREGHVVSDLIDRTPLARSLHMILCELVI